MGSERESPLLAILRRLHARGLEGAEWLALVVLGAGTSLGAGYNLLQFVLDGRLYIMVRGRRDYWAYWPSDATTMVSHGLITLGIFAFGLWALATALIYPFLIWRWGKSSPAYLRKPPLNIRD